MADAMARQAVAPPAAEAAATRADYIAELVRSGDEDRYWAALLMPPPTRDHLLALYALNIELARIGEQAREPQLGEIRLQWWRDALAAGQTGSTGHPVADAMAAARAAHDLPEAVLAAMIDARALDVHRESLASEDELRAYLSGTAGAVFRLGAWIAGARGQDALRASEEAAMAHGLTGLMRALPYHRARGQLLLPADFLAAFGVVPEAVLRGEESQGLATALGVLRERARAHLAAFRRVAGSLPAATLPAFLPLATVPAYLRHLAHASHRPLTEIVQLNPLGRYARIWTANLLGRI
jgi:15-cis-phytoene synthase